MASSKDNISAALGALSILSDAAADIYASDLQAEEAIRDRRFKEEQADKARQHQFDVINLEHQNTKELSQDKWKRDLEVQFPGLEWINGQPDLINFDMTKSQAVRESNIAAVTKNLMDAGLDTEGTDDELMQRNRIYQIGKGYGMYASGGMISPEITFAQGGDVSPYMMTSQDLEDFNTFFSNSLMIDSNEFAVDSFGNEVPNKDYNREVLSPVAIMTLQGMNLIPADIEIKTDVNGMQYISHTDTQQLKNLLKGIQAGVENNKNYMTNVEYSKWLDTERDKQVKYAGELAGSPAVVLAGKQFDSMKTNYAGMIGYQVVDNKPALNWGGELVELEEVYDLIEDYADDNAAFQGKRQEHINKILTSSITGPEALSGVVEYLRGIDHAEAQQAIQDLAAIESGKQNMSATISDAFNKYNKIQAVADKTSAYITDPVSLDQMMGVKQDMKSAGIYDDVMAIREMEIQQIDPKDPKFLALQQRYIKNLNSLKASYHDAIDKGDKDAQKKLDEMMEWIELEKATFDLQKSINFQNI